MRIIEHLADDVEGAAGPESRTNVALT
jgi:hypothetical protein